MNFGRILANAFARRIAVVVVALVLAWLGLGTARAQSHPNYSSQAAAYSACQSDLGAARAAKPTWTATTPCTGPVSYNSTQFAYECEIRSPGGTYNTCKVALGGTGGRHYLYLKTTTCSATADSTFSHDLVIPTGSVGCQGGCAFQVLNNGDGTYTRRFSNLGNETCQVLPSCTQAGWYLNHATSMCQPPQQECASNETKNPKTGECEEACPTGLVMDSTGVCKPAQEECPPGNVKAPSGQCLPGEGQCAAGEARRPNGTCGIDSDGDGQADEDDDDPNNDPDQETASGGDSCNSPPSCSGGPIDCLQVKIQWRIDCNTRRNENISGGACAAMPVCTGEKCRALEYSQLLMQWRTACALEKLKMPEAGEGGDGETIKPDFEALAGGGDGANPDDSIFLPDGDGESFNQSLVSYGAGLLGWSFTVEGQQFAMPQEISDFIAVLRWLIIAAASLVGIAIAWGRL